MVGPGRLACRHAGDRSFSGSVSGRLGQRRDGVVAVDALGLHPREAARRQPRRLLFVGRIGRQLDREGEDEPRVGRRPGTFDKVAKDRLGRGDRDDESH